MLALFLASAATLAAQAAPQSTFTAANLHLSVRALVEPEVVSPGSEVKITFDVTPARRMHVYAPGAEYQVITVTMDALTGVKAQKLVYPPSEIYHFAPLNESVPVYSKPFALTQALTVSAPAVKGKDTLTLSGKLDYQACDDRVCFKPTSIPFKLDLKVKK